MNRDTVIALAREAGFDVDGDDVLEGDGYHIQTDRIETFAALVAAAEREECAKMVEAFHRHGYDFTGDAELHEAIRSRT